MCVGGRGRCAGERAGESSNFGPVFDRLDSVSQGTQRVRSVFSTGPHNLKIAREGKVANDSEAMKALGALNKR